MSRLARPRAVAVAALLLIAVGGGWAALKYRGVGGAMTQAGEAFVGSLDAEQRAVAVLPFDDPRRLDWHFIPKPERKGLQIKHMTEAQREHAHRLLGSALSQVGYDKATLVMHLESILQELEKSRTGGPLRDAERYYFTIFGEPTARSTWGLSVEGHHLSLNFVVVDGEIASTTPTFYGANPATVKTSAGTDIEPGTQALRAEEGLAFELLASLSAEQKTKAVIAEAAPADIRGPADQQPPQSAAEGLPAAEMDEAQRAKLWELISAYAENVPEEVREARLDEVAQGGIENVHFAWAGASEPGIGHYYRVQGPAFLIEFVNTQPDAEGNVANHIHSVWRSLAGDFNVKVE